MKINENTNVFPPYKYYSEVDEKFKYFKPNCRVLPARYYEDHQLNFTLKKQYAPGENRFFPNGGFEVYGPDDGIYNFNLDEIVVHPFALGMRKYFSNAQNNDNKEKVTTGIKGKRGRPKKDPGELKVQQTYVPTGGKRGRKPLDPDVKAARDAKKLEKQKKGTGRRGRPKKQTI